LSIESVTDIIGVEGGGWRARIERVGTRLLMNVQRIFYPTFFPHIHAAIMFLDLNNHLWRIELVPKLALDTLPIGILTNLYSFPRVNLTI
jgi:hypothetical protein